MAALRRHKFNKLWCDGYAACYAEAAIVVGSYTLCDLLARPVAPFVKAARRADEVRNLVCTEAALLGSGISPVVAAAFEVACDAAALACAEVARLFALSYAVKLSVDDSHAVIYV